MSDFTKFRGSINGFNRSDVASYLVTLSNEHQAAMQALQKQLDDAGEELSRKTGTEDALRQELAREKSSREALQQKLEASEKALEEQTAMSNELLQQLDETETALKSTQQALEEAMELQQAPETEEDAPEEVEEAPDYPALELEAYRRAEAMERLSAERTARLRQELNDLLEQVSSRYEQTGQEIQVLAEDIRTNLGRLSEAMSDLDVIFDETAAHFDVMDALEDAAAEEED